MSRFADIDMAEVKTGATQKQPVWEPHAPLAALENQDFSFRTISSDFVVGKVPYKVSCFQMKAGFFDRYSNVEGILLFATMIQHVNQFLVDAGLSGEFGLDCATFKQDQGKNAGRNLCIYVMPLLSNGVRNYIDALTQDLVKKAPAAAASPAQPSTGWAALKPAAAATTTAPWGNQ